MPELPEVETVRRGLSPVMERQTISRAEFRRADLRWPFPDRISERLTGKRILVLRRRSKYLLADLDSGETLLWHLGMSGRVVICDPAGGDKDTATYHNTVGRLVAHDHVVFDMERGHRVIFNDPRRFGAMDLCATEKLADHPLIAKLGPEPLGNAFDGRYLADALQGRRSAIKSALLDQRIVAGLGNIYVCEALFRSGISPLRQAGRISDHRIERLVTEIRDVLSEAIDSGGSSLRDHRQTNGDLGYFQHNFRVYDREGECCRTGDCSAEIRRVVQSGRSSFYCAVCQR